MRILVPSNRCVPSPTIGPAPLQSLTRPTPTPRALRGDYRRRQGGRALLTKARPPHPGAIAAESTTATVVPDKDCLATAGMNILAAPRRAATRGCDHIVGRNDWSSRHLSAAYLPNLKRFPLRDVHRAFALRVFAPLVKPLLPFSNAPCIDRLKKLLHNPFCSQLSLKRGVRGGRRAGRI